MADLMCPYCEKELDVCHDDGQGYSEGILHQMTCGHCGKSFVFETSISFYYEPARADCLNGGLHSWAATPTYPKSQTEMKCSLCGERRSPTGDEMNAILTA